MNPSYSTTCSTGLSSDVRRIAGLPSLNLPKQGRSIPRHSQQRSSRVRAASDPVLRKPEAPKKPSEDEEADLQPLPGVVPKEDDGTSGVTVAWQRQQAKSLARYFEDLKLEKISQQPFFGWTKENEILNGRWVMFGIAVGLITEFATGVNFINQVGLMVSYLGIADFYD